jgi:hypothetical protein
MTDAQIDMVTVFITTTVLGTPIILALSWLGVLPVGG